MPSPPPDRGKDPKRRPQPLNLVRGGGICDPGEKAGHVMKGSYKPAVCMPTAGSDPRPRWRQAGKMGQKSRHTLHHTQHRKGGRPYGSTQ
jgi:hypothetical protein